MSKRQVRHIFGLLLCSRIEPSCAVAYKRGGGRERKRNYCKAQGQLVQFYQWVMEKWQLSEIPGFSSTYACFYFLSYQFS